MSPSIKLTYFDIKALAEPIRLLLSYGGIEFEDNRISRDDWSELKTKTPFGVVPVYEEDGKQAWQSIAICRYVAKKVNLAGENEWESLQIDAIVDTITDFRTKALAAVHERDEGRKEKLKETLVNETTPYYLERLNKIAEENGGHFVANKLSWADIYFFALSESLPLLLGEDVLPKYENLVAIRENVLSVPSIKNWIETRPKTQF